MPLQENHNATQPHALDLQPNHMGNLDSIQVALDLRNSAAGGHGLQRQSIRSAGLRCNGGRAKGAGAKAKPRPYLQKRDDDGTSHHKTCVHGGPEEQREGETSCLSKFVNIWQKQA